MKTLFSILVCSLLSIATIAQTTANATFFSQDGEKFWVIVDGVKQNDKAATNVKVTGLTNELYRVKIIFSDNTIPAIDQTISTTDVENKRVDATYNIRKDKKGKMVMRVSSFNESASTTASPAQTVIPYHTEETPATTPAVNTTQPVTGSRQDVNIKQDVNATPNGVGSSQSITTPDGDNVRMDMNVGATGGGIKVDDGMGGSINMNLNMNISGMDGSTQGGNVSSSTTVTQSSSSSTSTSVNSSVGGTPSRPTTPPPANTTPTRPTTPPPANTTPPANSGCVAASATDMTNLTNSIKKQAFSENKMNVAKTFIKSKCLSVDQIKQVMGLFTMDDDKLAFAKLAYDRCADKENYFMVGDALTFSSNQDDLMDFINSK